jgi:hypothetical protein
MNNFLSGFAVGALLVAAGFTFWPHRTEYIGPKEADEYQRRIDEAQAQAETGAKDADYWQGMALMYANSADSLRNIPRTKHLTDATRALHSADLDSLTRVLFADPTN